MTLPFISKIARWKKKLSGRDLDPIIDRINLLSKMTGIGGTQVHASSMGIQVQGGGGASGIVPMKIYEVQSSATGDGVYNCFEQTVDNVDWTSTTQVDKVSDKNAVNVEVWNAMENYVWVPYAEALFLGDRMIGWEVSDSSDTKRIVGVPVVPTIIRLAYAQEVSPAGVNLSVKLGDYKGEASGSAFDVRCLMSGGSDLNAAVPIIAVDDPIFIIQLWGAWYSLTTFITFEDCDCYTAP